MTAAPVLPRSWALWTTPATDGVTNMATDLGLLGAVRTGRAVWRWYEWATPTVSFGRHERVRGRYTPESLAAAGLTAVRRPTGGRALLHAREITYSVTLPWPAAHPWRPAYDAINHLLTETLHLAGIPVERAPAGPAVRPDGPVCFDRPAEGELVLGTRKLVGSAVWRQGDAYLQHGSILLADDQHQLVRAAVIPLPPAPAAATLGDIMPHRSPTEHLAALQHALRARLADAGARCEPFAPTATLTRAVEQARPGQRDPGWIWRH